MSTSSRHNLPAEMASFIGRERELTEINRLLAQTRLLTLLGPGGSGKTRLALRLARDLAEHSPGTFPDGIWLVQLAPLAGSALVPRAVAAALGVRGTAGRPLQATMAAALASRKLLLVLDNCEHLIGACARLAETLLAVCPHLRILATSREPLRVAGEVAWRVPPLAVPAADMTLLPDALATVASVALLLDRTRARQPEFALTAGNMQPVAAICRHLEGLPLGIELAAAQMSALGPEQVANRLDDSLRLLGGGSRTLPRQETLRATLDWSHGLLSEAEQTLFRRLAVFAGGFDLEAVEGVCAGEIEPDEALRLLTALIEKSLVEPGAAAGGMRYRLLEPVRQYAAERLAGQGEVEEMRRRHAGYYMRMAEAAEPVLMSGKRGPWMERLAAEQGNLREALRWSRQAPKVSDNEIGLRLAGSLLWFWNPRGEAGEALDWLEGALAKSAGSSPVARGRALYGAGEMAWIAGQTARARAYIEESVAIFRTLGERRWLAYALQSLPMAIDNPDTHDAVQESLRLFEEVGDEWGSTIAMFGIDFFALMRDGDPSGEEAAQLAQALERCRKLGDGWLTSQVLTILGDLSRSRGNDADAANRYEEALALLRREGLTGTVPSLLHNLGYLALRRGETRRALRSFRDSLLLFRDQGDQRGIADCLDGVAAVLAAMRQPERAARLFGAAGMLRQTSGAAIWPANAGDHDRGLALARDQLDDQAFAAARAAGRGLSEEQAIAEALAGEPAASEDGAEAFGLTPREREVVALLAGGLTNRQIAAALVITEGTARLHVKHVLQKLGFSSRTQVAAWAVEQGLANAPEVL